MTILTIIIAMALSLIAGVLIALAIVEINSDGHYTPSEADKQAQRDAAELLKNINRSNT